MQIYQCIIGEGFMNEDELPKNLPREIYDWWFDHSHVDFVRIGPIVEKIFLQPPNQPDRAIGCLSKGIDCNYCPEFEECDYIRNRPAGY